ncbi:MAG: 5-methylthioadenosine phosphorylase [Thermoanaerobacteraceae bacterium]|jgi:5'-methylthioadenosine phosphorylase|uniref:Purine nucleoside phosphorylase n=1 Tax=Biomaibacter acetigenes TaxID=2316383 RepID=A0A3G2R9T7_9FIRM|nr:S-methyl-5'-thioadenosine phosphorylase [Biomaibacter acetigenes]AYO31507.1 S-methyl-5'-thioadenosine phosphorylase [Biomaibacter acetigenes]MDK2877825.1 5-methylthioadenosine phosphorylase [Thermoanaerobacteraceae bacterium]MDN5301758.1 5-methylthioadenosine phosphorylase [Thermoanaerobacteraceae bacterium]MDN5313317.1 5-methylthioadenosine phosphorylase [Thermoanaerobacteraceae bacterium]
MEYKADVGVFGGSGFYSFLDDVREITVETPYGPPSDKIALAKIGEKTVAFLPRHGKGHTLPPHMINYRANIYAMKQLGVTRILGPCASGSLQPHVKPGDFVICDQFVNRTWGRKDTFYDGPITTHIGGAEPYCPELRKIAIETAREKGLPVHERGTMVVIQGPRFSTKAESREFSSHGWEVINMTQYPEVVLAREMEICYANITLITDYDVGLEGNPDIQPVSHEMVLKVFNENIGKLKDLLYDIIRRIPEKRNCRCGEELKSARMA